MKKAVVVTLFLGIIFLVLNATLTYYQSHKVLAHLKCRDSELIIKMAVQANFIEGDQVGFAFYFTNENKKERLIYHGDLSKFYLNSYERRLPINTDIAIKQFSDASQAVDIYLSKVANDQEKAVGLDAFSDSEFTEIANCIEKNKVTIDAALASVIENIPSGVFKRSGSYIISDVPRIGAVVHTDLGTLNKRIGDAFDTTITFTGEYGEASVDFNGLILFKETGTTNLKKISSVFTFDPSKSSAYEKIITTKNGNLTFANYLQSGQEHFGIKFK